MSDVKFTVEKPYPALRYAVARRAILSLAGRAAVFGDRDPQTVMTAIQRRIRVRLSHLRQAGWPPVSNPDSNAIQYMRNCPPVGCKLYPPKYLTCSRRIVCPYCWARSFPLNAFMRAELLLYGSFRRTFVPLKEAPRRIVRFSRMRSWLLPSPGRRADFIAGRCASFMHDVRESRRNDRGMGCASILFSRGWTMGDRLILATDILAFRREEQVDETYAAEVMTEATKATMVPLFARVFAYPQTLMTALPEDVIALDAAFGSVRMLSMSGEMYGLKTKALEERYE